MPETLLEIAHAHYQKGQLQEALDHYLAALQKNPNQPELYHCIGVLLSQLQKYQEAVTYFDQAIDKNPAEPSFHNSKGNALSHLGELQNAILSYQEAIQRNPHYAMAYNNLGNCFYRLKKTAEAARAYRKALVLVPGFSTVHFNYGRLQIELGHTQAGIKELKKAIALDPDNPAALGQLAHVYLHQNNYAKAIPLYQKRLTLQPNHAGTCHQLGLIYLKTKNFSASIEQLEHALLAHSNEQDTHYLLATAFLHLGQYDKALTHYLQQLEHHPLTDCYYNVGVLHMYQERHQDAIDYFHITLEREPNYKEAHLNLAAIFLKRQEIKRAVEHYQAVLALDPTNDEVQHILSALTQSEGFTSAPPSYVQHLFDQYAPYYEEHLTKYLNYQAPQKLLEAVSPYLPSQPEWVTLDLGCGTGLCGELFKPFSKTLIGIDLSENMLEIARRKNCYDQLLSLPIETALAQHTNDINLIVAADVFPYIGALETIFNNVQIALKPNGYFLFTIEETTTAPFVLQSSIRYAHAFSYVQNLCQIQGLQIVQSAPITLRREHKKDLLGRWLLIKK